jgi:hypothetical protein
MPDDSRLAGQARLTPGANTTLAVVAVNAALDPGECKRVAMMAQDGLSRAVRPAHTPFDGDVVFALASGEIDLGTGRRLHRVARLGSAAGDCLARAIARGVYLAEGLGPGGQGPLQVRRRGDQLRGVRMLGIGEDLGCRALLDDLAGLHHQHPIGQAAHHAHVVGDEQIGQAQLVGELGQVGPAPRRGR